MVCQVLIREISVSGRNASSEPIQLLNTIMASMGQVRSSFIGEFVHLSVTEASKS